MPAYKDKVTGKWFVKFYCKNWQGENKQIKKGVSIQSAKRWITRGITSFVRRQVWI